jgi:hypothetical protein
MKEESIHLDEKELLKKLSKPKRMRFTDMLKYMIYITLIAASILVVR